MWGMAKNVIPYTEAGPVKKGSEKLPAYNRDEFYAVVRAGKARLKELLEDPEKKQAYEDYLNS